MVFWLRDFNFKSIQTRSSWYSWKSKLFPVWEQKMQNVLTLIISAQTQSTAHFESGQRQMHADTIDFSIRCRTTSKGKPVILSWWGERFLEIKTFAQIRSKVGNIPLNPINRWLFCQETILNTFLGSVAKGQLSYTAKSSCICVVTFFFLLFVFQTILTL